MTWGLALVGTESAGRVIAWIGMAMFAALALGAPIGNALRHRRPAGCGDRNHAGPADNALVAPLSVRRGERASLLSVLRAVWMPGFGSRWGNPVKNDPFNRRVETDDAEERTASTRGRSLAATLRG